jgi:hypothetical protein
MSINLVVPYRQRRDNLARFVPYMEQFLKGTEFRILVVEQADEKPFNKGALLNIGVSLVRDRSAWAILHDVDMLPLNCVHNYLIPSTVRHLAGATQQYGWELPYPNYFGGVLATTIDSYEYVNGYSNRYWGWGAEDDDFLVRLWVHQVPFERAAGRYQCLPHLNAARVIGNSRVFRGILGSVLDDGTGDGIDPKIFRRTPLSNYHTRADAALVFRKDGFRTLSFDLIKARPLSRVLGPLTPSDPQHEIVSIVL